MNAPIDFTIAVFLSGQKLVESGEMKIGTLQMSAPVLVHAPEPDTIATPTASPTAAQAKAARQKAAGMKAPKPHRERRLEIRRGR